jgi:hypothetical protein
MSLSSTKLLPTTKTVVEYNNGNCTLCLEDETYNENGGSGFTIGNSGPIQGMDVTVTCDLVNEIAPLVRYISKYLHAQHFVKIMEVICVVFETYQKKQRQLLLPQLLVEVLMVLGKGLCIVVLLGTLPT